MVNLKMTLKKLLADLKAVDQEEQLTHNLCAVSKAIKLLPARYNKELNDKKAAEAMRQEVNHKVTGLELWTTLTDFLENRSLDPGSLT